jgi:hypothetical protein
MAARGAAQRTAVVPYTWGLYFPDVPFQSEDRRAILSAQLRGLFSTEAGRVLLQVGTHDSPAPREPGGTHDPFRLLRPCANGWGH